MGTLSGEYIPEPPLPEGRGPVTTDRPVPSRDREGAEVPLLVVDIGLQRLLNGALDCGLGGKAIEALQRLAGAVEDYGDR